MYVVRESMQRTAFLHSRLSLLSSGTRRPERNANGHDEAYDEGSGAKLQEECALFHGFCVGNEADSS